MGSEAAQLLEAADFAAHKHRQQRRKDPEGTPYINHPIGVARILTHEAGITDIVVLQAALLHDTVEDTDTTLDEVELHFGAQVRRLVEEVTDDKTLPKLERKRQQVEQAPHSSPGAKLVKLADKLYNLRDLNRCTPTELHLLQCSQHYLPSSYMTSDRALNNGWIFKPKVPKSFHSPPQNMVRLSQEYPTPGTNLS
ncbi:guanosine-3',5'-bis(diphosphate) 3'-pyrophosphohydrolase MESH1 isoform 2 [Mus musculus]|uniref:guanosine-3',5'-bis(diphosphate) 3'-pyrophosphohydrolase MESH1 isoform 2 n=1 Tax=Mus musculus TaxID=10090 RepID=UPI0023EA5D53|nr:guanosine-3',5'-bis(diphosphate) 3'-pyrophosphohydrolase MESH1 isoform 2 [Mus musculus]